MAEQVHSGNSGPPAPAWVHWLAVVTTVLTFFLICAGGLVKSQGAGLSVPDWPQSYGRPYAPLIEGLGLATLALAAGWVYWRRAALAYAAIASGLALALTFYLAGPQSSGAVPWYRIPNVRTEHGHRLIAGSVGFLTALLAGALLQTEPRRWMRRVGLAALGAVSVQAVLGGLTVRYHLPALVSAAHASVAQAFFALLTLLALASAPGFSAPRARLPQAGGKPLQCLCAWLLAALYLQALLGAALRHTVYLPGESPSAAFYWHLGAHLAGLLCVAHALAMVLLRVARRHANEPALARPGWTLAVLAGVQVLLGLGALLVRLKGDAAFDPGVPDYDPDALVLREWLGTSHVALGALLLGAATWTAVNATRLLEPGRTAPAAASPEPARGGAP